MARVLVTGANGHMGANTVRQLQADNHEVIGMVRHGADLAGIAGLDIELRRGDVLDADAVRAATQSVDVVAHLAAAYNMRVRDPEEVIQPAVVGVRNVLSAAAANGVNRVIHVSSVAAVGLTADPAKARDETDWNDDATQPYYRAKAESERRAWQLAGELSVPMVVLCPAMVLGPFDYRVTPSTHFVRTWVDGTGMTGRGGLNVVDVRDVAEAVTRAIDRGTPGERYIVGGENITQRRAGELIGELTGKRPTHLPVPRALVIATAALLEAGARLLGKEPAVTREEATLFVDRYSFYDTSKARQAFELKPRTAFETLEETVRWLVYRDLVPPEVRARIADRFPPDPEWQ
jgi:dihydroflavonol-4-reductase